jgi:hypothetical protein
MLPLPLLSGSSFFTVPRRALGSFLLLLPAFILFYFCSFFHREGKESGVDASESDLALC